MPAESCASLQNLVVEEHVQELQNVRRGSCGKKATVKPLDIHRRLSAICGYKTPARSPLFSWVRSFNSGKASVRGLEL